jgi:hypothetical protein
LVRLIVERHSWPLSTRPARLRLVAIGARSEAGSENDREPTSRMGTSVEDGWRGSSRPQRLESAGPTEPFSSKSSRGKALIPR